MNNKKRTKMGGAWLNFFYEVGRTDIIAILQTPGIFLIQILNTNMY